ncbi:MAG: hypothetical protein H7330_16800 [Hymenobacteraceae bacterium]|nr:hypothetical protein [Hymenobacteraceae bacterium]
MEIPAPTPPPAEEASPRRNPLIPEDQDQKAALALFLATAWAANPQLVLIWITQAAYATKAAAFAAALKARNKAGALVPQQSRSFDEYDEEIRKGLNYVKNYISETYGEDSAESFYAEFGIKTRGTTHELPRAQAERADALEMLEAALVTHGLGARPYGTAYWEPIADGYATLTGKARKASANVSKLVGMKNEQVDDVEEVLSAMISLVDAQYRTPEARQAKLRELGFQREYR